MSAEKLVWGELAAGPLFAARDTLGEATAAVSGSRRQHRRAELAGASCSEPRPYAYAERAARAAARARYSYAAPGLAPDLDPSYVGRGVFPSDLLPTSPEHRMASLWRVQPERLPAELWGGGL